MQERLPLALGDVVGNYKVESLTASAPLVRGIAASKSGERASLTLRSTSSPSSPDLLKSARAAMGLKSAHIARVLDAGTLASGAPFALSELVDGSDLAQVLKRDGVMRPYLAIDYVRQACEGLDDAHRLDILHERLSPASLALTHGRDGAPLIKVCDVLVAKLAPEHANLAYLAPEQIQGATDIDARADIWALGVILFELVTGHGLFDDAAAVLTKPMPVLEIFLPAPPPGLADVIRRCLEKDRKKRYMTVGALSHALMELGIVPTMAVPSPQSAFDNFSHPSLDSTATARRIAARRAATATYVLPRRRSHRGRNVVLGLIALAIAVGIGIAAQRRAFERAAPPPTPPPPSSAAIPLPTASEASPLEATATTDANANAAAAPVGSEEPRPHRRHRRPKPPRSRE